MTSFRHAFRGSQDHYSILQISRSATLPEVKAAYKRLALQHHPDRHGGSPEKRLDFQKLSEAYEFVLQDIQNNKRRRDVNVQGPHFRNINYRKVYAPRPPPDWKFTWNHEEHREMHYGKGLQREALKQTLRESEKELKYESPLGKGFTFSSVDDKDDDAGSSKGKAGTKHDNVNPFSKNTPQGPPKVIVDYQEGEFDPNLNGRARMNRQERIVLDMYSRRTERIRKENKNEQRSKPFQYAQYHRFHRNIFNRVPEQTPDGVNSTFVGRSGRPSTSTTSNECAIL